MGCREMSAGFGDNILDNILLEDLAEEGDWWVAQEFGEGEVLDEFFKLFFCSSITYLRGACSAKVSRLLLVKRAPFPKRERPVTSSFLSSMCRQSGCADGLDAPTSLPHTWTWVPTSKVAFRYGIHTRSTLFKG
jgi:hypothetical protein